MKVVEEREKLYFSTFNDAFLLLFKQEVSHFHFALSPTNCLSGTAVWNGRGRRQLLSEVGLVSGFQVRNQ